MEQRHPLGTVRLVGDKTIAVGLSVFLPNSLLYAHPDTNMKVFARKRHREILLISVTFLLTITKDKNKI
jgi:hypothetical protein